MTRRHDLALAAAVLELLTLTALLFLWWAQWRGFQPDMCEAYGACGWRRA